MADVLAKGTGLVDDADGAIKEVGGKLDRALDGMKTTLLNVNDIVVGLKAGRGPAGMLLRDQALAASLRETLRTTTSNVNEIVADLAAGRGAAGLLLRDQALAAKIQGAVSDLNHASGQADTLISSLQSGNVSGKVDQLISNANSAAAHADESILQIHQIRRPGSVIQAGTAFALCSRTRRLLHAHRAGIMSIETIIIISITAGVHVIGLALLFFWMAIGSPMSIVKFKERLKQQFAKRGHP
jgi:hypothetical protein